MTQKRSLGFAFLFLIALNLFLTNFVTAQTTTSSTSATAIAATGITNAINFIQETGKPFFGALFGQTLGGDDLFVKILTFLLVILVVMATTERIPIFSGRLWFQFGIGVIISVLGVRFIPAGLIQQMAIPSSALAAVLVLGIPFVLLFIILEQFQNSLVRRAGWAVYTAIIIVLWFYNVGQGSGWAWIYVVFALACIIAFAFDGTLQKFLQRSKAKRGVAYASGVQIDRIVAEIRDLEGALANAPPADQQRIKREIGQKRRALETMTTEV